MRFKLIRWQEAKLYVLFKFEKNQIGGTCDVTRQKNKKILIQPKSYIFMSVYFKFQCNSSTNG